MQRQYQIKSSAQNKNSQLVVLLKKKHYLSPSARFSSIAIMVAIVLRKQH